MTLRSATVTWGFLGCGNLAQAIILGGLEKKQLSADHVFIANRTIAKSKKFSQKAKVQIASSNSDLILKSDIIVVGIKPLEIAPALLELQKENLTNKVVVCLAAGVDLESLKKYLKSARTLVRVMANTPVTVGHGVFGVAYAQYTKTDQTLVDSFFKQLGVVILCPNDRAVDAITSGAASGVGFVFSFMEEFAKFFVQKGFSEECARLMTIETFAGAAALADSRKHKTLAELREAVTSRKGTTLAGLEAMNRGRVAAGLRSGLGSAFLRAQEIAKSLRKTLK